MNTFPLLRHCHPSSIIAWKDGKAITQATFLSHVAAYQNLLPQKSYVINLCTDRYLFLIGFAAALLRNQTTLLPLHTSPSAFEQLSQNYPSNYYITDNSETEEERGNIVLKLDETKGHPPLPNPEIPEDLVAVIAFTSGTTGTPQPYEKTWGSMVAIAQKTGAQLKDNDEKQLFTMVATVPHQHMYGLETSIMLPLQHGWAFESSRPFFPEDIRITLSAVPTKRILVTTPIHLRACVREDTQLPSVETILSATAPLSDHLAREAEKVFHTKIMEIYGFAEAGTIATRRTVQEKHWTLLTGLCLRPKDTTVELETPYHQCLIPIPDTITIQSSQEFFLEGRPANLVNIGGHRASLDDLSLQLSTIDGVKDAVFYLPHESHESVTRLIAFAVAPDKTLDQIWEVLRTKIASVFLPRPLYLVDALPRNPTGKLTEKALKSLANREAEGQ
ncbi:AMP-binding protein [Candidatus Nitrospira salsa]